MLHLFFVRMLFVSGDSLSALSNLKLAFKSNNETNFLF
jgi:hypothetical protein